MLASTVASLSCQRHATVTAARRRSAEVDEDASRHAAPEFSNVTIRNPFGDGEIEVEEISLSDLPGFANAASNDARRRNRPISTVRR